MRRKSPRYKYMTSLLSWLWSTCTITLRHLVLSFLCLFTFLLALHCIVGELSDIWWQTPILLLMFFCGDLQLHLQAHVVIVHYVSCGSTICGSIMYAFIHCNSLHCCLSIYHMVISKRCYTMKTQKADILWKPNRQIEINSY